MKIDSHTLDFASQHSASSELRREESLRAWIGQRPPDAPQDRRTEQDSNIGARIMGSLVQLSAAGRAAQRAENDASRLAADIKRPGPALRSNLRNPPAEAGLGRMPHASAAAAHPSAPAAGAHEAQAIEEALEESNHDPRLLLIRQMVKMLTGEDIKIYTHHDLARSQPDTTDAAMPGQAAPASPRGQGPAGFGIEYQRHEIYTETEQTDFQASGLIRTADGREISFQLQLQMSRSYREESHLVLRAGDAQRKDPLVINFDGAAAQLTSQRFSFDLEGDGAAEQIAMLAAGSGYLALDLDGNERIDSGRELFGVASGDGFQDLARHDNDGNGWIDENDAIYEQLRVWTPSSDGGGQLQSLRERQVGALYLGRQATPFELRDENNQSLGAVRSSGVWLSESGQVGSLQQIDLAV